MTVFAPMLASNPLDPTKRVKYTLGMVLGVDDFDQEYAYLANRNHWLARDLLGFGTVRGLRVHVDPDPTNGNNGPEVVVDPGIGLTPEGRVVRVKVAQCAYLNAWLNANPTVPLTTTPPAGTEPTPPVPYATLYVVIRYKATPTDMVPIPGEPCRSETDASAPSRLADDFDIELATSPPVQVELDAMHDLLAWLAAVQVVPFGGVAIAAFLSALRQSVPLSTSNPTPPPPFTPPVVPPYIKVPATPVLVNATDVASFWRAALRVYVTELRANDLAVAPTPAPALWLAPGQTAQGDPPTERNLLLAKLLVPVTTSPLTVAGTAASVLVHDDARPILVPSALLQTALVAGPFGAAAPVGAAGAVVAAGTVPVLPVGTTLALNPTTTVGNVVAQATAAGVVTITFSAAAATDPATLLYVVKVIAVEPSGSVAVDPVVTLLAFPPTSVVAPPVTNGRSFSLRLVGGGTPVPAATLATLHLVMEITSYTAGAA